MLMMLAVAFERLSLRAADAHDAGGGRSTG